MNSKNMTDFMKPTIITAQQYGTKVSVEINHSDTDISELFDAFQTICIGLGYNQSSIKNWITQTAEEYIEADAEDLKEKLEAWKFDEDFIGQIEDDEDASNKRMDIIGQNGNEGLHYRVTDEDADEFDDYGQRVEKDRVGFEWGDDNESDDLFEEEGWLINQKLVEANERFKNEVKKMNTKQKKKSKK